MLPDGHDPLSRVLRACVASVRQMRSATAPEQVEWHKAQATAYGNVMSALTYMSVEEVSRYVGHVLQAEDDGLKPLDPLQWSGLR